MDEDEREDEYYNDWLSDNIYDLKLDFVEDNEDMFFDYCKERFKDYLETK
jgi:hypothetical protein